MKCMISRWFFILCLSSFWATTTFAHNNTAGEDKAEHSLSEEKTKPLSLAQIAAEITSKGFASVGKKAIPAVVFIRSECSGVSNEENPFGSNENPFESLPDGFFHKFFGIPIFPGHRQTPNPQISGGSGFIISSDGKIVTNHHVVKDATTITVVLKNGEEKEAKLLGADPRTDLAVLKIESQNLPYLTFGNSDQIEIGEWAIPIGSPFGLQATLTHGVISAKGRQDLRITDLDDLIQTDAPINPGNSGGPLCNILGEVIGINTAILSKNGGSLGIGFAIPSKMAKHVIDQIVQYGGVQYGYLGAILQAVDKEIAEAFNLKKVEGVLIAEIVKDFPAEKAGLKQGDIIVAYNDLPVKNIHSFRNELSLLDPGTKVQLKVLREGKLETFNVVLAASPEAPLTKAETLQLGIEVSDVKMVAPEAARQWGYNALPANGLVITHVKPGSIGERAGLRPGIFVLQVNQRALKIPSDFYEEVQKSSDKKHIVLLIRLPNNSTRFITIKMK